MAAMKRGQEEMQQALDEVHAAGQEIQEAVADIRIAVAAVQEAIGVVVSEGAVIAADPPPPVQPTAVEVEAVAAPAPPAPVPVLTMFAEYNSGDGSEDDSDDVNEDTQDAKSRCVLRRLENGDPRYRYLRADGTFDCPFCGRITASDLYGIVKHAIGVGASCKSGSGRAYHTKAKHSAFDVFLQCKYGVVHVPYGGKKTQAKKARRAGRK